MSAAPDQLQSPALWGEQEWDGLCFEGLAVLPLWLFADAVQVLALLPWGGFRYWGLNTGRHASRDGRYFGDW